MSTFWAGYKRGRSIGRFEGWCAGVVVGAFLSWAVTAYTYLGR